MTTLRRGEEVFHVYEFGVSGSTTLDNGITVAVHSQLGSSGGAAMTVIPSTRV